MSLAPTLYYVLWLLQPCLLGLTAGVMFRRKLHNKYPFFFGYLLFDIFRFFLEFALFRFYGSGSPIYFAAYWSLEAVGVILEFVVVYEVFSCLWAPYSAFLNFSATVFRWAGALIFLMASVTAVFMTVAEPGRLQAALMVVDRSLRTVQIALLVLFLVAVWYFGLSLKSRAFGIVFGFGVFAALELAVWAMRLQMGRAAYSIANLLEEGSYACAMSVWLIYMAQPEPELKALPAVPETDIEELNQALRELVRR